MWSTDTAAGNVFAVSVSSLGTMDGQWVSSLLPINISQGSLVASPWTRKAFLLPVSTLGHATAVPFS